MSREHATSGAPPPVPRVRDLHKLLHEHHVRQVELELQNEELRNAREALEAARDMYADLYDFAPVGYFKLDRDGTIRGANARGADLLGRDRPQLVGRRFGLFVSDDARMAFADYLERLFRGERHLVCDVTIPSEAGHPVWLRIEAVVSSSGEECRAAVTDISDLKREQ